MCDENSTAAQAAKRRSNREEFHARSRYYVTERPPLITAVFLDNEWVSPFVECGACFHLRRLFCIRCTLVQQSAMLAYENKSNGSSADENDLYSTDEFPFWRSGEHRRKTFQALMCMILLDVVTLGMPCGPCYHGIGTTCVGCQTRWLIRKKYRLKGFGYLDCLGYMCAPMCTVHQQASELTLRGIPEPPSPCFMID